MDAPHPTLLHVEPALDVAVEREDLVRRVGPHLVRPQRDIAQSVRPRGFLHDFNTVGEQTQPVRGLHDPNVVINRLDIHVFRRVLVELQPLVVVQVTQVDHLNRVGPREGAVEYARVIRLIWQPVAHPVERIDPLAGQQARGPLPNRRPRFGEQVGPALGHPDFIPTHTIDGRASTVGGHQLDAVEVRGHAHSRGIADHEMPRAGLVVGLRRDIVGRVVVRQHMQPLFVAFVLHDKRIVFARCQLDPTDPAGLIACQILHGSPGLARQHTRAE